MRLRPKAEDRQQLNDARNNNQAEEYTSNSMPVAAHTSNKPPNIVDEQGSQKEKKKPYLPQSHLKKSKSNRKRDPPTCRRNTTTQKTLVSIRDSTQNPKQAENNQASNDARDDRTESLTKQKNLAMPNAARDISKRLPYLCRYQTKYSKRSLRVPNLLFLARPRPQPDRQGEREREREIIGGRRSKSKESDREEREEAAGFITCAGRDLAVFKLDLASVCALFIIKLLLPQYIYKNIISYKMIISFMNIYIYIVK